MSKSSELAVVAEDIIINKIYLLRGQKVMIDRDLAELYGVETKRLKEQVKRNIDRFPPHFMFELTAEENEILRSHFATLTHTARTIKSETHRLSKSQRKGLTPQNKRGRQTKLTASS